MIPVVRIEAVNETSEVQVHGDFAWCWSHLSVTITPRDGGQPSRRAGHTLSILRKEPAGNWVVIRDANLLAPA
jgi:ketosteroid isomerase-like protein